MAKFGFDVSDVEVSERGNYDPMPKGEYTLKATDAELKETARGDGTYLAVTFEVVKPAQYNGRKVWQNFNIVNPNEKAEKIGREQVAGWARAAGRPNARDSDELIERSFDCNLDIEKGNNGYSDRNKITSFLFEKKEPSGSKFSEESKPEPKREEPVPEKKPEPKKEAPASSKQNPWD